MTVCTHNRSSLFGEIVNGEMRLNDVGRMIATQWRSLSKRFPSVQPDAFISIPKHMHGIIALIDVGAALVAAQGMARRINPPRRATTCPYEIIGHGDRRVQIIDNGGICAWGENIGLAAVRWYIMATELL